MKISSKGVSLVKQFEGLYLVAYPDPASPLAKACKNAGIKIYNGLYAGLVGWAGLSGTPWTKGWGRTEHDDGSPIEIGETVTPGQADLDLVFDVQREGSHFVDAWVKVAINQDQYDALSSFVYNEGAGTFHLSHVLALLNQRNIAGAADALIGYDSAQGTEMEGLLRRRWAERALFLSQDPSVFYGADWRDHAHK